MKSSLLYIGNDVKVIVALHRIFPDGKIANVSTAFGAIEWLEHADGLPSVIVADQDLALTSGTSVKEILDNEYNLDEVVFVVLTDHVMEELREDARQRKVDDIWEKPLQSEVLSKRLDWLLTYKKNLQSGVLQITRPEYRISLAKRAFDVVVSGTAILAISPILLMVAAAIKIDSKGPVFYISKRVGTGYRVFPFYKFRSMRTDADHLLANMQHLNQYAKKENTSAPVTCKKCDAQGKACSRILVIDGKEICENLFIEQRKEKQDQAFVKISNDPRVTRLGHFIRNTSIDELPQLFNIFLGHMSIVGNRPLPLYEAEKLTTDKASERFMAPAGLTGLWQVTKRGKKDMDADERRELDNTYARTHSFWGDIKLIARTIPALLQKDNV